MIFMFLIDCREAEMFAMVAGLEKFNRLRSKPIVWKSYHGRDCHNSLHVRDKDRFGPYPSSGKLLIRPGFALRAMASLLESTSGLDKSHGRQLSQ